LIKARKYKEGLASSRRAIQLNTRSGVYAWRGYAAAFIAPTRAIAGREVDDAPPRFKASDLVGASLERLLAHIR